MLTQSKETRNAWRASQRTLDIKVTIDGKTYGATDINSLKYDSGAYNGDTFAIGSTYSNTVQIEFSHLIEGLKLGMEVRPSIGIKTSSGYVYEPLGVFIISSEIKMDRNNNLTTVSASDRFCGLEGGYVSKLTYPAKVLDVIAEICAQSGVKANTDDLARLPHQADLPAPITGQSYRKALGWIAQLYVGYALFDRQGLFTIRTISEPNYELDPSQYEQAGLTKNEAAYKINGIQCQVTITTKTRDGESTEETKTYQAGDATGSQIKLENNIMTPQRLNDIWEQLKDLTFYPFSLNWFGNPAVEAGDWLRLEDKQGNSFVVPNSSYTLDFNGGLSATSKADQTTSSDQMVPWQGNVAQTIKELKIRRSPDGTVVFPPSVTEPPANAKFNDVWFKKNGNSTELWIFEKQDDGSGKWIRKDLSDDEIKKKVADAQQGLNQAKADIINNKQKADTDIENLNKSIEANKKVADQDIQNLNKSIEDNKKVADESLQKLNDSVTNLQGQYDNNVVPNLNKVMADASDALQKYISAQNSIADLTKQAQQQGKDIADVSNTVKGLNINYANLAGDVNSTKVDVKGLQTTVGTANGDIAQLKLDAQNLQTMLAGKVDNTTYTNFVNLTNQALNARLTASDLNGYAKTADVQTTANGLRVDLNSVTDRMNNLKVGGRNLVAGTDQEYTMGFGIPNTTWKDGFAYVNLPTAGDGAEILPQDPHTFWYTLTPDQEYTQTIWFQTDALIKNLNAARITWFTWGGHDPQPAIVQRIGQNSYKLFSSYKWPGKQNNDVRLFDISELRQAFDLNTGTYLKFGKLKLETGNVSTDWTPAVEDTAHDLEQLSARITTTSQQFSSYYTKAETDNRTNSAKSDAVNAIKSDSNWQGLSNILTNSGFLQTADGFLQKVQQTTVPMFNGGGVNLVKDTSESEISGKAYDIKDYYFSESLEPNTKYTISIDAKVDQEALNHQQFIFVDPYTANWSWGAQMSCVSASLEYQHYRYTFITPDASQKVTNISVYLAHPDGATNGDRDNLSGTGYFKKLKVERGEIDTPYSHAPSDNASQIAFSELLQSLDGLRSTVGSNYGSLQSQLSQTATAIRGELTNNVAGLQNQIAANASGITALIQGNPVSLIRKGSFEDGSKGMWDNSATIVDVNNNNVPFTKALCISKRDSYEGKRINVTPGDHYLVKAWIKSDEAQNNRVSVGLFLIKKDGKVDWINGAITVNHDWELVTGEITIPNDVVAAEGWIQIDATQNFGYAYLADISITKISDKTMQVAATLDGLQSTVSNNYGNLQSQISQSSSAVRTEFIDKLNGVQNQITTTANGLDAKIGAIQVGGRNLLIGTSEDELSGKAYNFADYQISGGLQPNKTYTISGWARVDQDSLNHKQWVMVFVYAEDWSWSVNLNINASLVSRYNKLTFTTPDGKQLHPYVTVYLAHPDGGTNENNNDAISGWSFIKKLKLEEGNIATDYTHAPEDTEKSFTEVNAAINGLRSTVSNNYGQLQSLNTQTATAIRSEVTDKVNRLQGQITTQANNIDLTIGSTGDLSNICRNPTFDNHDGWTDSVHVESNWPEIPTKNCGVLFTRDGYYGKSFTVVPGDRYYTSVFANNQNDVDFILGLHFKMKDGSDQWLGGSRIGARECRQSLGSITVPDNAITAQIWASIQKFDNFGFTRFTNVIVKKNDTLAQINMSAGATLIQNNKIYMDASSTVFSGKAFIPSAAITSLNADKITAGTINGAKVNVINLNANNITAGTLRGSNGEFYLDSGALHVWQNNHDAWIDQNGIHDYDNQGNNVWIKKGCISAYGNTSSVDIRDGEIHLNKKMWVTDNVLASDYGTIAKADNVFNLGTSGLALTGTDGFLLKTSNWNDGTLTRMGNDPINGSGIAGNNSGFMQLAAGKQLFLYAGPMNPSGGFRNLPHLVLDGTVGNEKTELFGYFSSYNLTSLAGPLDGGLNLEDDSVMLKSLNGKNGFSANANGVSMGAGDHRLSLGGLFSGVNSDFSVVGNFTVTGSKNAVVPTSRGMAAINAYETAEYYFGDIGETQTNSNGVVTVMIDPYFLETVNTLVPYQVFLTSYGNGNVWVSSRSANNFTVKSSNPNIHFAWEIKAKRKGYENDRMKIVKGVFNNEQY